jgi:hypothetical protein
MDNLFLVCSMAGGAFLIVQFALMILGLSDGDVDLDAGADVDFDAAGGDFDGGHGDSWFVGVLSIRTITAAVTAFGLAGWAARGSDIGMVPSLAVAIAAGMGAMYAVYWLFRSVMKLEHDGTVHIENAVGKHGTVYVPIPAAHAGSGKIQMKLQDRIKEYQAVTPGTDALPTGAKIVVTSVVSSDTLEVEPILETAERSE